MEKVDIIEDVLVRQFGFLPCDMGGLTGGTFDELVIGYLCAPYAQVALSDDGPTALILDVEGYEAAINGMGDDEIARLCDDAATRAVLAWSQSLGVEPSPELLAYVAMTGVLVSTALNGGTVTFGFGGSPE